MQFLFTCALLLITFSLLHVEGTYEDIVYNDTIIFDHNYSVNVYDLDPVTIYLYKGVRAPIYTDSVEELKGAKRGNIQGECFKNRKFIKSLNLKGRLYLDVLSYEGIKLSQVPWVYSFNPYSPVYAIPFTSHSLSKYDEDEAYADEELYSSISKDYEKMGTFRSIFVQELLAKSLAEYRVLPSHAKFWSGAGCDNWKSGNKNSKGYIGTADYRVNFMKTREVRCSKKYEMLCLLVT